MTSPAEHPERLPVVYVRGYGGPTAGIDRQVDDPFYGFNSGATHVRVGGDGAPLFYQFEGPLLRLMIDEEYQLLVRGDQQAYLRAAPPKALPSASLWVYRFYDEAATTFTAQSHRSWFRRLQDKVEEQVSAPGYDIERAAAGLYEFIRLILDRTGADRVYLVAHSMGGLISRCMLQKVCRTEGPDGPRTPGEQLVAKLFTYATPHGGIATEAAIGNWFIENVGPAGADIFAPAKMYGYLDPDASWGDLAPDKWDPRVIPPEAFPTERVFCLVGTDPTDYGLAQHAVGPKSDGLVQINNAYVRGADRAFVHRSHSGRYGEVNSEEGYQNLRRFLFGAYRVRIDLRGVRLPSREEGQVWQADVRLAVRGLPIVMHEQQAAHYCPIQLDEELTAHQDNADAPVPLATVYLLDAQRARVGPTAATATGLSRYSLSLKVFHLTEAHGSFSFGHHLEQVPDWEDVLVVDVGQRPGETGAALHAWTAWNSAVPGAIDSFDPITDALAPELRQESTFVADGDELHCDLPVPAVAAAVLGAQARVRLTVNRLVAR